MSAMRIDGRDATLRLEGEVGRERRGAVVRDVNLALRSCAGIVWLDLGTTRHLHYEVARALVQTASDERRLQMVGASPYVRQILRLVGGVEGELWEGPPSPAIWGDAVA
jgi:hypothetical protein